MPAEKSAPFPLPSPHFMQHPNLLLELRLVWEARVKGVWAEALCGWGDRNA